MPPTCGSGPGLLEVVAAPGHANAAVAFGLTLAAEVASASRDATVLWVREAAAAAETGEPYGPGLMNLGIAPDGLIGVAARTQVDALRAALEGARCAALSVVILETINAVDLTASRRLKLASEKSGVAIVLIRLTSKTVPNAARMRWRVSAEPQTVIPGSRSLVTFRAETLKHPAGRVGTMRIMEWDHERRTFAKAISLPLAAVSDVGSLAA